VVQGIGIAFLLLLAGSQNLFGSTRKAPCFVSLSGEVLKHTKVKHSSGKPDFSKLINKQRAELLTNYYRRTPKKKIYRLGIQILRDLLSDAEHLIEPSKRTAFLYSVKHFMERNGRFVIDADMSNFDREVAIVSVKHPSFEYIRIPLYKLLNIELGLEGEKENLLYDLTHELRHSITDNRTRQALIRNGVRNNPSFIYGHIGALDSVEGSLKQQVNQMSQSIAYAYQLEREAVAAQAQFVPQAPKNNGDINFYPQLQSLQRLLNDVPHKDLKELHKKVLLKSHYRILVESYADNYISYLENVDLSQALPKSLEGLMGRLADVDLSERTVMSLAMLDYDYYKYVIRDRLSDKLASYLKTSIGAALKRKELRILRAYQRLQASQIE